MKRTHIEDPKKILAIRFMRLGDVILLLPALARLKARYPRAHLTLLTDERCAPLAEMCPYIDEVMPVNRLAMRDGPLLPSIRAITNLIGDVRRRRFDLVIDFLSFRETNLLTWISGAAYRLGMKRHDRSYLSFCFNRPPVVEDKALHVADMFQRIVTAVVGNLTEAPPPCPLVVSDSARAWAIENAPELPIVSLYVGAPVPERRWPADGFARVAGFAIERLGASVVVLAGEPESEIAESVRALCRRPEKVSVFSRLAIPQLAALIARSRLLVSNDTGPMHLGPALGIPTLGIFSVGYPEHFRPLGEHSRFVRANPIGNVSAELVMRHIEEMSLSA
jgi:ADP-heptose:LPS heptosyltransferase